MSEAWGAFPHTWQQTLLTLTPCLWAESSNKGMSPSNGWPLSSAWPGGYHDTTTTPETKYRGHCDLGILTLILLLVIVIGLWFLLLASSSSHYYWLQVIVIGTAGDGDGFFPIGSWLDWGFIKLDTGKWMNKCLFQKMKAILFGVGVKGTY